MAPFFKKHVVAIVFACVIGAIYGLPNVLFVLSLGDVYQGIPMMQTPNEDAYLARIQEILDGHPTLGSPYFFEYKEQWPITPPTGEFFYALPSLLFNLSTSTVLIVSKFILPAILFFLVYLLVLRLTGEEDIFKKSNAIVGGAWVVLGYDLIDYRTVFSYLLGTISPESFLLWARPVNPILGALFLFSFLLFVLALVQNTKWKKSTLIGAAVFLALMFGSYFFSWGLALSILVMLVVICLFSREYEVARTLALIAPLGVLFAAPYWYVVWHASQSPWYEASVLRSGLFLTHYPLLNKLLLVTFALYLTVLFADLLWKRNKHIEYRFEIWHRFTLALLLGGLWVYSQQMLTGRTLWPYHFVQYTIPLSMVVCMVLLYNVVRKWSYLVWSAMVGIIAVSSMCFGVYTQVSTYRGSYARYAHIQGYAPLFAWLNEQKKDCVVLQIDSETGIGGLDVAIPAFTHCNLYNSATAPSLLPEERIWHNYFVRLFMNGVTPATLTSYLDGHLSEERTYLSSNWKGIFGVREFPDFSDPLLAKRLMMVPEKYREFFGKEIVAELKTYRLDFIVSVGPLAEMVKKRLPGVTLVQSFNDVLLYKL